MPSQLPDDQQYLYSSNVSDRRRNVGEDESHELTPLCNPNHYQDELKSVTHDDVFSYMCSLAMEKCSKKSEKKKASCGGAAMRKRLLIKNFVAQMLAQERENSTSLEGMNEGGEDEDNYSEDTHMNNPHHHHNHNSQMEVDMDDVEDDEEEEESPEDEEEDEDDDDDDMQESEVHSSAVVLSSLPCVNTLPISCTSYSAASTIAQYCGDIIGCNTSSSNDTIMYGAASSATYSSSAMSELAQMEQWEVNSSDHTVPPASTATREYMLEDESHCHHHHQESLSLYSLYSHQAHQYSGGCPPVGTGGYPLPSSASPHTVVGALPDNLLEDMSSMWEVEKATKISSCPSGGGNELGGNGGGSNSCALASLVNMVPSMMLKVGCCRAELSQAAVNSAIYSRCITDLDTNCTTVVEEDYHSSLSNGLCGPRSPTRKRPIPAFGEFGQDGTDNTSCNLMMLTTSPKRVKL